MNHHWILIYKFHVQPRISLQCLVAHQWQGLGLFFGGGGGSCEIRSNDTMTTDY
eukprot:c22288_g1_i1 orf=192-353(+)